MCFLRMEDAVFYGDKLLMYESFFALKEKPFALTPNPRFLFLSKTHNEVYAHLIYGIESRAGFVEVTGEVGTGKTTILRTLLSHLDEDKYRVSFIFNPKLNAFELLRNINREFGVADDGLSSADLIQTLNEFLLAENQEGRTPILVIDEAQNLSGEVLEQIRLLSNLETEEDKLIQVVLVGQSELRHHLSDHSLRQLNQRIAVRYQLRPLNREETNSYILHRLNIAGRPDGNVFTPSALKKVFQCSGGVPRRINLICDRALLTAYSEERGTVSPRDVKQAVAELAGMGEGSQRASLGSWNAITVTVVMLLFVMVGYYWFEPFGRSSVDATVAQTENQPATFVNQPTSVSSQPVSVSTQPVVVSDQPIPPPSTTAAPLQTDSLIASCNAVFSQWGVPLLDANVSSAGFDFDHEFTTRGFELVRLAGHFDEMRVFDVPLLLPLSEEQGGGYLAVLGQTAPDRWSVAPAYQGREMLSSAELNNLGMRMALVPWVDFSSIGYVAVPGVRGDKVLRLQFLLGLNGCVAIPTNGRYDASSIKCVKDFQREHGLVVDGLVGPRTLMLLYQVAGAYDIPRLKSP
jgi:general secretion pathway protein A